MEIVDSVINNIKEISPTVFCNECEQECYLVMQLKACIQDCWICPDCLEKAAKMMKEYLEKGEGNG